MNRRPRTPKQAGTDTHKSFCEFWRSHIEQARRYREKHAQSKLWKDYRRYYRGDWSDSIVPVNMVFSYGRALIPRVYFNSPRVVVTALHPDYVAAARVVEAIDNLLINQAHLKATLKTSILDAFLCGTGPIKLGYDSEFGYLPELAVNDAGETLTQEGYSEPRRIEYKEYVRPGMPWAIRVLPEDIFVPYGYKYSADMPWIAHRIYRPLDDVKNDTKYQNTTGLKGTHYPDFKDGERRSFLDTHTEVTYAELYEIRDLRDQRIIVLCEDQVLLAEDDALQMDRWLPYEFIIFNEDPEHFWGIPDVKLILAQQLELNTIRTQSQRHRAIALLKFLALRGVVKEEEVTKFLSGEVGPFVEIDAETLANSIQMMQPHIPPDLSNAALECKNDIREILGFDYNQAAMLKPGTPPTATESSIVAQSFNLRADERRDTVAEVLVRIIEKWNKMIFEFWNEEKVIEVAGPEGAAEWVRFKGQELRGEYKIHIDPDTGFPINHAMRMQYADKLLGMFGGDPMVNAQALKQMVLEQYEWVLPGASKVLITAQPEELAQGLAMARQPVPMGTGKNLPVGNRGGGMRASSPENPLSIDELVSHKGEGGS